MHHVSATNTIQSDIREAYREERAKRLNQSDRSHGAAEHPHRGGAPDLVPRRQPRELVLDEVEIVLDRVEVAARLVDLAQREGTSGMRTVCQSMVDQSFTMTDLTSERFIPGAVPAFCSQGSPFVRTRLAVFGGVSRLRELNQSGIPSLRPQNRNSSASLEMQISRTRDGRSTAGDARKKRNLLGGHGVLREGRDARREGNRLP
jgi:hypothetical protein